MLIAWIPCDHTVCHHICLLPLANNICKLFEQTIISREDFSSHEAEMSRAILSGSQNMWQRYLVLWTEMTNAEPSNFRRCEALRTQPLFRRIQWLSQFINSQDQRKKEVRFCKIWPMQKYNLTLLKNLHFLAFLNRNVIWELPFFSFQFGRRWNVQFGKWPFNRWPTTQSSKPSNSHFKSLLSWHFVCPPRRFGSFFSFLLQIFSPLFV